eukprot:SAG22_NODE_12881_length_426_cov_0.807339_1_plen_97_part_01
MSKLAMLCLLSAAPPAAAALDAGSAPPWRREPASFCDSGVDDARLHKNTSAAACQALCAADPHCKIYSVTNTRVPALEWCFVPSTDCPKPCTQGGCT